MTTAERRLEAIVPRDMGNSLYWIGAAKRDRRRLHTPSKIGARDAGVIRDF
jgi:hypothetical protein